LSTGCACSLTNAATSAELLHVRAAALHQPATRSIAWMWVVPS
jgi:hypothetical protein